jgi:enamine deaminase RidA (YjgF/YER057c/UK114 family)
MSIETLNPDGWPRPKGYSNGIAATGRFVFVAGQIGWNASCEFESDDLVDQVAQALNNVVSVLRAGGAGPEHIARMTWYVTDRGEYVARSTEIGQAYRSIIGRHYPTMTAVEVSALIEERAKVEIEATAVVGDRDA